MAVLSAREFNHDVSAAKRAAAEGPVIITDHGAPSHVLLSIDEYERLVGAPGNLATFLAMDTAADLDEVRLTLGLAVPDL